MIRCGRLNLLTDVPGVLVGNAEDLSARTGVSIVLCERPAVAAVDVRGGAPGTRETDALAPGGLVEGVDAVVLSGGSVFGLEAATTVTSALAARGRGMKVAGTRVPIVPSAILFDLHVEGNKRWGGKRPLPNAGQTGLQRGRQRLSARQCRCRFRRDRRFSERRSGQCIAAL